ncbi:MAG: general secretion pathway protein GspC [Myxococcales bacterium]|jgi:general secretion pathway protein C|nr:general secretion pathway protein GspC [Myxococcales bacterium]
MAFDQILKRNFWGVPLVLVAGAAFLNAQAITQLIGVAVSPDDKQLAAAPAVGRGAAPVSTGSRSLSADRILSRNAFDHVAGPLRQTVAPSDAIASTGPIDTNDPYSAPACDGVKVLVIAASADPEWSFASISGGGEAKSVLRRRGMDVGGKKVHFVGWDRVWLENGGSLCQAQLFGAPVVARTAPVSAPPTTPPPTTGGSAPSLDPAIAKGIQKNGPHDYNVDRGVLDKILENQADLMRQARIVPEQENGKVVGIRLFGVRPDTLLGHIGLENGDRLQTINGFEMGSPEKALEAYARLRTADKLTVQINRRGQNINLDYNIK